MLEYDRNGVPLHDGSPEYWEECQERPLDLYYGRAGDENRQRATAIHLRSGLRGVAYETVRSLTHSDLLTVDTERKSTEKGVLLLLSTLSVTVQKEAPLRAFELFDRVFYSKSAMRASNEPMHAYIQRRKRDFERLKLLSPSSTLVSQRTAIISFTGNSFDQVEVERAMRTQSGEIHTQRFPQPNGFPKAGKGKYGKGHAWAVDGEDMYSSWPEDDQEQWALETEAVEEVEPNYDQESYEDAFTSLLDMTDTLGDDDELIHALAIVHQRKGKGKGKAKGKGKQKEVLPPSQPAISNGELPFKLKAEASFKMTQERQKRLVALKQRTKCSACGKFGHWAGNKECGGKKTGSSSVYFSITEIPEEEAQAYAVRTERVLENRMLTEPCTHCLFHDRCVQRGANGRVRTLRCEACDRTVVQVARPQVSHARSGQASAGAGLWQYFVCVLMYHCDGENLRQRAGMRIGNRPSIGNQGSAEATETAFAGRVGRQSARLQSGADLMDAEESSVKIDWLSVPMSLADQPATQESVTMWFREILALVPGTTGLDLTGVPDEVVFQELLRSRNALEQFVQEINIAAAMGRSSASTAAAMMAEVGDDNATAEVGVCVLDTACTCTLHGVEWGNRFRAALAELGLSPKEEQVSFRVRGINGAPTIATRRIVWPVGIGGQAGQISSLAQAELGTVLDVEANVADFNRLGLQGVTLTRTGIGHIGLPLLDFPEGGHPWQSGAEERLTFEGEEVEVAVVVSGERTGESEEAVFPAVPSVPEPQGDPLPIVHPTPPEEFEGSVCTPVPTAVYPRPWNLRRRVPITA
eukprot:1669615-Amphidinium_carterae.1